MIIYFTEINERYAMKSSLVEDASRNVQPSDDQERMASCFTVHARFSLPQQLLDLIKFEVLATAVGNGNLKARFLVL
jgi:hypothetical protein